MGQKHVQAPQLKSGLSHEARTIAVNAAEVWLEKENTPLPALLRTKEINPLAAHPNVDFFFLTVELYTQTDRCKKRTSPHFSLIK